MVTESITYNIYKVSVLKIEDKNMEEEKLIPSPRRKSWSRPRSSPSASDKSPVILRRPATAKVIRVSGAGDSDQNSGDGSLLERDEKQTVKMMSELGGNTEALVQDKMRSKMIDEGWTETNVKAGGYDDAGNSYITHMNEQIPYENPPRYCKNASVLVIAQNKIVIVSLPAVDYSSIRHLLELTEGETDLDSDKEIPDIFSKVNDHNVSLLNCTDLAC